jgi:hypothetical protein
MLLKKVEAIMLLIQSTYQTTQRLYLQSIKQGTDKQERDLQNKTKKKQALMKLKMRTKIN